MHKRTILWQMLATLVAIQLATPNQPAAAATVVESISEPVKQLLEAAKNVSQAHEHKLKFTHLNQYDQFYASLQLLLNVGVDSELYDELNTIWNAEYSKKKKTKEGEIKRPATAAHLVLGEQVSECLRDVLHAGELKRVLDERHRVCDPAHIIALEKYTKSLARRELNYYAKHSLLEYDILEGDRAKAGLRKSQWCSPSSTFVKAYGTQVALTCERTLIDHLHDAEIKIHEYEHAKGGGHKLWQIHGAIERIHLSLMCTDKRYCYEHAQQLRNDERVKEISYAYSMAKHYGSLEEMARSVGRTRYNAVVYGARQHKIHVPHELWQDARDAIQQCNRLYPYYASTIITMIRLIQMGYDELPKTYDDLKQHHSWHRVKLWMGYTHQCQVLRRLRPVDYTKYMSTLSTNTTKTKTATTTSAANFMSTHNDDNDHNDSDDEDESEDENENEKSDEQEDTLSVISSVVECDYETRALPRNQDDTSDDIDDIEPIIERFVYEQQSKRKKTIDVLYQLKSSIVPSKRSKILSKLLAKPVVVMSPTKSA